jgi:hypoxanthine phosphoribosyltransferase
MDEERNPMTATDEQIALLRMLDDTLMVDEDTGEALADVLAELAGLRKLRDAVLSYKKAPDMHGDEEAKWAAVEAALAECGK